MCMLQSIIYFGFANENKLEADFDLGVGYAVYFYAL
jgi:hypothetical protein